MKKGFKKICGLFGLALVIVTTIFAANLSPTNVSAADSASDTVQVQVVGAEPLVVPSDATVVPEESIANIVPDRVINFDYYRAESLTLKLAFTPFSSISSTSNFSARFAAIFGSLIPNASGETTTTTLFENEAVSTANTNGLVSFGINTDDGTYTISRSGAASTTGSLTSFGYGSYTITLRATNEHGLNEQVFAYEYFPLWMNIENVDGTKIDLKFKYNNTVVCSANIALKDDNKNKVINTYQLSAANLSALYSIDLASLNIADGTYALEADAYNCADPAVSHGVIFIRKFDFTNQVVEPEDDPEEEEEEEEEEEDQPSVITPDTGYFLRSTGASSNDILATALIVFVVAVILAIIFTARHNIKAYHNTPVKKSVKLTKKPTIKSAKSIKTTKKSRK